MNRSNPIKKQIPELPSKISEESWKESNKKLAELMEETERYLGQLYFKREEEEQKKIQQIILDLSNHNL
jgi:hypothetical protein